MARERAWPEGARQQVSKQAYYATMRARGYGTMTPEARLEAALSYDRMFGLRPDSK